MNTPPPLIHILPIRWYPDLLHLQPPNFFDVVFFWLLAPSPYIIHLDTRTQDTNPHLNPSFPEELWVNKSFLEKTLWTELWRVCSKPAHLRSIFVAGEQSERAGIPERHATAAGYRFEKKPCCVYVREINALVELMFWQRC